jgi:hypothetical protein
MLSEILMQTLVVCLVFVGVGAVAAGIVIVVVALRKAPDGYEDQGGFHVGRRTETFVDGLRSYGWPVDPPDGDESGPPPTPPKAK